VLFSGFERGTLVFLLFVTCHFVISVEIFILLKLRRSRVVGSAPKPELSQASVYLQRWSSVNFILLMLSKVR